MYASSVSRSAWRGTGLEHEVRPELHHVAVLDRPRLALVRVHDDERGPAHATASHFTPVGKPGAAVPRRPDASSRSSTSSWVNSSGSRTSSGSAGRPVAPCRERRRGRSRRRVSRRSEVAVTEAGDLDRPGRGREKRPRAEAVADGSRAHPEGVHRHLQEGVEGDDLVDVAAAEVHAVGERVGQLGVIGPTSRRIRPRLSSNRVRSGGSSSEQAREPEDVHAASVRLPLSGSQGDARVVEHEAELVVDELRSEVDRGRLVVVAGSGPRRASGRSSGPAARRSAPARGRRRPVRRPAVPPRARGDSREGVGEGGCLEIDVRAAVDLWCSLAVYSPRRFRPPRAVPRASRSDSSTT